MVKITKGANTFTVTIGAFENIFKNQGFVIVNDENISDEENNGATVDPFIELREKPVSQWTKNEIIAFAAENNIDIHGTKNIGEARQIIIDFLSEAE